MDNKNQLIFKYVSPTTIIAKSVTGKEFEIYAEFCQDESDNWDGILQAPFFDFMLKYDGEGVDFLKEKATQILELKAFDLYGNRIDIKTSWECWYHNVGSAIAAANEIERTFYLLTNKTH